MTPSIKVTRKQVAGIINATFPDYKGRKFSIEATRSVILHDLNWDGGTKNEYAFIRADGLTAELPEFSPFNNPAEGKEISLPNDVIVVNHIFFCGHDCGIRIMVNPDILQKVLPQPVLAIGTAVQA